MGRYVKCIENLDTRKLAEISLIVTNAERNQPNDASGKHIYRDRIIYCVKGQEQIQKISSDIISVGGKQEAQKSMQAMQDLIVLAKRGQIDQYQKLAIASCSTAFKLFDEHVSGPARPGRKVRGTDCGTFWVPSIQDMLNNNIMSNIESRPDIEDALSNRILSKKSNGLLSTMTFGWVGGAVTDQVLEQRDLELVGSSEKAWLICRVCGMQAIDQSLLTPEVSRAFNDVLNKLSAQMNSSDQVKNYKEMSEAKKFKLEDL